MRWVRGFVLGVVAAAAAAPGAAVGGGLGVQSEVRSGLYPLGEEVVFSIVGEEAFDPGKVRVTITRDGFENVTSFEKRTEGEGVRVRFTPEGAGWYMCEAAVEDADSKEPPARAGVVVGAETIGASVAAPEDLDAFWDARRAALAAMPLEAEVKAVADAGEGIECFEVTIPCPQTKAVRGYYARPKGAGAKRYPAILYVRAAGVAGHWCRAWVPNATSLSREYGAIVVDINAHGMLNGQAEEYYQELERGELRGYWAQGATDRDEFYFVGMYVRLLRAIEFLSTREEWDGRHLVTMGESQGGGQALAAAGLDGRVSAVAALVPAMCDLTGPVAGRCGGWSQPVGRDVGDERTRRIIEAVRYCDNVHLAARSRAETLVFIGLTDTTCPAPGILAAYNALGGAKRFVAYPHKPHNGLPEEDRWLGEIDAIREAFIRRHIAGEGGGTN